MAGIVRKSHSHEANIGCNLWTARLHGKRDLPLNSRIELV